MSLTDLVILDPLKRCAKASDLIYSGRYEQAREILGSLWRGVSERPAVDSLPPETAAEILLQCGVLSGFIGAAQAKDAQEKAMDMLSEALRLFQASDNPAKVSEAKAELGCCYFRIGSFDEARSCTPKLLSGRRMSNTARLSLEAQS